MGEVNVVSLNWDEPNNQPKGGRFYYYLLCKFLETKLLPLCHHVMKRTCYPINKKNSKYGFDLS